MPEAIKRVTKRKTQRMKTQRKSYKEKNNWGNIQRVSKQMLKKITTSKRKLKKGNFNQIQEQKINQI